jgi:hypothetical protein
MKVDTDGQQGIFSPNTLRSNWTGLASDRGSRMRDFDSRWQAIAMHREFGGHAWNSPPPSGRHQSHSIHSLISNRK